MRSGRQLDGEADVIHKYTYICAATLVLSYNEILYFLFKHYKCPMFLYKVGFLDKHHCFPNYSYTEMIISFVGELEIIGHKCRCPSTYYFFIFCQNSNGIIIKTEQTWLYCFSWNQVGMGHMRFLCLYIFV